MKEQLKKMGSFEYYQTSFSYSIRRPARSGSSACPSRAAATYLDRPAGAGHRLHRGRDRGRHGRPLPRRGLGLVSGTGKLKLAGGVAGAMKESVQRAFSYLQAEEDGDLGIARDARHVRTSTSR